MNDVSYLILPATHFFSLPNYVFHDLQVPQWAFDEERATSRRPAWSTLIQREGKALLQLGHQFTARPSGGDLPAKLQPCLGLGPRPLMPCRCERQDAIGLPCHVAAQASSAALLIGLA